MSDIYEFWFPPYCTHQWRNPSGMVFDTYPPFEIVVCVSCGAKASRSQGKIRVIADD